MNCGETRSDDYRKGTPTAEKDVDHAALGVDSMDLRQNALDILEQMLPVLRVPDWLDQDTRIQNRSRDGQ